VEYIYIYLLFSFRTQDPIGGTRASSTQNSPESLSDEACKSAKAAATSLRQLIQNKSGELTSEANSLIILYFDGPHKLYGRKTLVTDLPNNYYQALLTAIDVLQSSGVVVLISSSYSHMAGFVPLARYVLSSRAQPLGF
jgi:hypothetical protein